VKDDVNANFALANSTDADGRAFNAASSVKVSIQELAHKVRDILGVPETPITYHPWRSGDILDFDVDTSALAELGVAFSVDFDEALTETVNWYRELLT
jgi:nucleoside-diphosphate-sugar epimerase